MKFYPPADLKINIDIAIYVNKSVALFKNRFYNRHPLFPSEHLLAKICLQLGSCYLIRFLVTKTTGSLPGTLKVIIEAVPVKWNQIPVQYLISNGR